MPQTFFKVIRLRYSAVLFFCLIFAVGMVMACYFWGNRMYSSTQAMAWPILGQVVVVDAGHGGGDPGVVGANGALEKNINLAIATKLAGFLKQAGANVLETRTTDTALAKSKKEDMAARVQMAKDAKATIFISIHGNGFPSAKWRGGQVFYKSNSETSQALAKSIQDEMQHILKNTDRKPLALDSVYIMKNLEIDTVIIEVGFLSNPAEEADLQDKEYQSKMAWSIYSGLVHYYAELANEDAKESQKIKE